MRSSVFIGCPWGKRRDDPGAFVVMLLVGKLVLRSGSFLTETILIATFLPAHDFSGKPVSTFPDRALEIAPNEIDRVPGSVCARFLGKTGIHFSPIVR
jgi:hypothetical protein